MSNEPRTWWLTFGAHLKISGEPIESPHETVHVIEHSAFEQMRKERDEALAKPATFIKLDETTEAFAQTRGAIENMKMFAKDKIILAAQLHHARRERDELKTKLEYESYLCGTARTKVMEVEQERDTVIARADAAEANLAYVLPKCREHYDQLTATREKLQHFEQFHSSDKCQRMIDKLTEKLALAVGAIHKLKIADCCWCDIAIGDPRISRHTSTCEFVTDALERLGE